MRPKFLFVLAVIAVAYLLGARAGRERYEQITHAFSSFWNDPSLRNAVVDAKNKGALTKALPRSKNRQGRCAAFEMPIRASVSTSTGDGAGVKQIFFPEQKSRPWSRPSMANACASFPGPLHSARGFSTGFVRPALRRCLIRLRPLVGSTARISTKPSSAPPLTSGGI